LSVKRRLSPSLACIFFFDATKLLKKIPKTTIIFYEFSVTTSFFYWQFQIESFDTPNRPLKARFIVTKLSI